MPKFGRKKGVKNHEHGGGPMYEQMHIKTIPRCPHCKKRIGSKDGALKFYCNCREQSLCWQCARPWKACKCGAVASYIETAETGTTSRRLNDWVSGAHP